MSSVLTIRSFTARVLYGQLLDYFFRTDDPQYNRLKSYAKLINGIEDANDKEALIIYFENETGSKMDYFTETKAKR